MFYIIFTNAVVAISTASSSLNDLLSKSIWLTGSVLRLLENYLRPCSRVFYSTLELLAYIASTIATASQYILINKRLIWSGDRLEEAPWLHTPEPCKKLCFEIQAATFLWPKPIRKSLVESGGGSRSWQMGGGGGVGVVTFKYGEPTIFSQTSTGLVA